jgi:serine/threonine protein kinase
MDLFDKRYEKIAPIGRGAFAEVWQATDTQTGVTLALKIFTVDKDLDEEGMKMLTREFALMIDADHRNLLRPLYFGISNDDSRQPYLTMPFCKNGNINKMIGKMTERDAWKLIRDTASALTYLHAMEPPIIHQDIKPANILIGNDGYYKLSDFGVSIRAKSTLSSMAASEMAFSSAGTISYMAPEKFSRDTRPIMANDIWSLGAMVYEMLDGDLPFGNDGGLLQKKGADIPLLHGDYSQRLLQTLDDCLNPEPWKRPMAGKLEEIAIDALSKAPTVKMGEAPQAEAAPMATERIATETSAPVAPAAPQPTESVPPATPTEPARSGSSKNMMVMAAILALFIMIGVGIYLLLRPAAPDAERPVATTETITTEKQELPPPTKAVTPPAEPSVSEPSTPQPEPQKQESATKQETVKPVQKSQERETSAKTTSVQKTEEKPVVTSHSNLSYGQWSGQVSGGKPVGFGSLTFTASASIHCTNGKTISPQAGDKITNAEFDDHGYLYQGTWIKNDGQTKTIMP